MSALIYYFIIATGWAESEAKDGNLAQAVVFSPQLSAATFYKPLDGKPRPSDWPTELTFEAQDISLKDFVKKVSAGTFRPVYHCGGRPITVKNAGYHCLSTSDYVESAEWHFSEKSLTVTKHRRQKKNTFANPGSCLPLVELSNSKTDEIKWTAVGGGRFVYETKVEFDPKHPKAIPINKTTVEWARIKETGEPVLRLLGHKYGAKEGDVEILKGPDCSAKEQFETILLPIPEVS